MKVFVSVILFLSFLSGKTNLVHGKSVCDGKTNEFHPYAKDCGKYIFCSNGNEHVMKCPVNLWFDVTKNACEHRPYATNPYCQVPCTNDGIQPDKTDCRKYIFCNKGRRYVMTCPRGLHFDIKAKKCEDPNMAQTPYCKGGSKTGGKGEKVNITGLCKSKKNGTYAYVKDCSKYISCSNNIAHLMRCPNDLWYDVIKKQCEHQRDAVNPNCTVSLASSASRSYFKRRSHLTWHTSLTDFCRAKYEGRFSYKLDCSKYILCDNGITKIMPCPHGTHFDKTKSACVNIRDTSKSSDCFVHVELSNPYVNKFCSDKKRGSYKYLNFCKKYIKCDGKGGGMEAVCPPKSNFYEPYHACIWENIYPCKDPTTTLPTTKPATTAAPTTKAPTTVAATTAAPTTVKSTQSMTRISTHTPPRNFCNKRINGNYPDPYRCDRFIVCRSGFNPTYRPCPAGLWYNEIKKVCDWPTSLNCVRHDPLCLNLADGDYIHPKDCSKFIICSSGRGVAMTCPKGLRFNALRSYCDIPANVQCPHTTGSRDEEEIDKRSHIPSFEDKFCYRKKIGNYPHPNICTKFITCNGVGYIRDCPANLWFNKKLDLCDYPHNVHCNPGTTSHPPHTTAAPTTAPSTKPPTAPSTQPTHPPHSTHAKTTVKPTTDKPENIFCKGKSPGNYAHPNRCDGYIACVTDSVGYFMICPSNLWYNPKTDRCDYTFNVNCKPGTTSRPPHTHTTAAPSTAHSTQPTTAHSTQPTTAHTTQQTTAHSTQPTTAHSTQPTTAPSTQPTTAPYTQPTTAHSTQPTHPPHSTHVKTTVKPTTDKPENIFCKGKPSGNYAHPSRCDGYIACVTDSVGYFMICPSNLWYNPKTDRCDYQYNVNCKPGSTNRPPHTHTTAAPTTAPSTHPTHPPHSTHAKTTVKPTTDKPENIFCKGKSPGNYAHPNRCDGYIACVTDSVGYFMKCPSNLWYNPKTDRCDYPHLVNCNPSIWRYSCRNKPAGVYPSPTHCNQFYKCDGKTEKPLVMTCPRHTNFYPKIKLCVSSYAYSCEDPLFCAGRSDGYYTNKYNCAGYYRCYGGKTYPSNCPIDQRFDGSSCLDKVKVVCPIS